MKDPPAALVAFGPVRTHAVSRAEALDLIAERAASNEGGFVLTPNVDHIAIMIEPYDDDAIRAYLSQHGVKLGDTRIRNGVEGEGSSIYIWDPEGNTIELKGPPDPAYN